jgi:hypothetical protein
VLALSFVLIIAGFVLLVGAIVGPARLRRGFRIRVRVRAAEPVMPAHRDVAVVPALAESTTRALPVITPSPAHRSGTVAGHLPGAPLRAVAGR